MHQARRLICGFAVFLIGCSGRPIPKAPVPSTVPLAKTITLVRTKVVEIHEAADEARKQTELVKEDLATAQETVTELEGKINVEFKPLIDRLRANLNTAEVAANMAQERLDEALKKTVEAETLGYIQEVQIQQLDAEIVSLGVERDKLRAQNETLQATIIEYKTKISSLRRLAWGSIAFSGLMLVFLLRKPIMRMFGVPAV